MVKVHGVVVQGTVLVSAGALPTGAQLILATPSASDPVTMKLIVVVAPYDTTFKNGEDSVPVVPACAVLEVMVPQVGVSITRMYTLHGVALLSRPLVSVTTQLYSYMPMPPAKSIVFMAQVPLGKGAVQVAGLDSLFTGVQVIEATRTLSHPLTEKSTYRPVSPAASTTGQGLELVVVGITVPHVGGVSSVTAIHTGHRAPALVLPALSVMVQSKTYSFPNVGANPEAVKMPGEPADAAGLMVTDGDAVGPVPGL